MNALLKNYVSEAVEFRPMAWMDLEDVMAIENAIYPYPWSRQNFEDSLAEGYHCWVCRALGQMVGYFVLAFGVEEAHLLTIAVAKPVQRQGFGARLLRHALEVAKMLEAQHFFLEVRTSNAPAIALYRHFGFAQIGIRKAYYPAAHGREDALVLKRSLRAGEMTF